MEKDVVSVYNGILLSHKKNEILPFAATQMDLEGIMLSEISQTNTGWYHLYGESKKRQQTSDWNKKETDSQI